MLALHGKKVWTFGVLILLTLGSLTPAFAQSIWLDKSADKAVYLEILKMSPRGADNLTFLTSTWFLSGRYSLGSGPLKAVLIAEIPFAKGGTKDYYDPFFDTTFSGESDATFGNPYFGVEIGTQTFPVSGEFGLRLPLVSDSQELAWQTAYFTDYDRFEAFLPDVFTINGKVNFRHKDASGLLAQFRLGPTLLIPTEGGGDAELLADYSLQLGYEGERFGFLGGFTGKTFITEDIGTFAERTVDQVSVAASVGLGQVRPGVYFRVPLDNELSEIVNFVIGINVGYRLP